MLIKEAIKFADDLSPNQYTLEEKLFWCNEVSTAIRRNVKKHYSTLETVINCSGDIELPDDIHFSDIEMIFIDGMPIQKSDFRSLPFLNNGQIFNQFGVDLSKPKIMRIIYLIMPKPVTDICIKGKFKTDVNRIYGTELPFSEGDLIKHMRLNDFDDKPDWSKSSEAYVQYNNGEYIELTHDILTAETESYLAIKRVIDDETEADSPYDRMYIEYILAKISLYQHDYETYSAHTAQYNNIFDEFRREFKTRNPLSDMCAFRNYW